MNPANSLIIKHPDPAKINATFAPLLAEARALKVVDLATAKRAGELLQAIKGAIRFLCEGHPASDWEGFDGPVKAAFDGHKFLVKLRDMATGIYEDQYKATNGDLLRYEAEERRKAEEAARAAEAAARKAEEERALLEAIQAEEAGDTVAAQEILAAPITAPAFTPAALPKIEGRSVRESYKAKVVDLLVLAKWCVQHPEDLALLDPNISAINARARSQRKGFRLPGCELVVERVAATRVG
jgi:hypothetical protein